MKNGARKPEPIPEAGNDSTAQFLTMIGKLLESISSQAGTINIQTKTIQEQSALIKQLIADAETEMDDVISTPEDGSISFDSCNKAGL